MVRGGGYVRRGGLGGEERWAGVGGDRERKDGGKGKVTTFKPQHTTQGSHDCLAHSHSALNLTSHLLL